MNDSKTNTTLTFNDLEFIHRDEILSYGRILTTNDKLTNDELLNVLIGRIENDIKQLKDSLI